MDLSKVQWLVPPPPKPGEPEHLNCFQRVLLPFAGILNLDQEQAKRTGAYLGGGLGCGGACGPAIAALLLLGELCGDPEAGKRFLMEFAGANGSWICEDIRDEEHIRCEKAIRFAREYIERISRQKKQQAE